MAKIQRPKPYAGITTRNLYGTENEYTWNQSAGGTGEPLTHGEMDVNLVALDQNAKNGKFWEGIKSENFAIDITVGGLFIDNPYNTGGGAVSSVAFDPATYIDYRHDSAAVKTRILRQLPQDDPNALRDSAHDFTIVQGNINSYKGDLKLQNGKIEYGTAGDQAVGLPDQGLGLAFHDTVNGETMRLGTKQDLLIGTTSNPVMGAATDYSQLRVTNNADVLVQFGTTAYGTSAGDYRTTFLQLGGAGDTPAKSKSPGLRATQNSHTNVSDWNLALTSWDHANSAYVDAITVAPNGSLTFAKDLVLWDGVAPTPAQKTTLYPSDTNGETIFASNIITGSWKATGPVILENVTINGILTYNGGSGDVPIETLNATITHPTAGVASGFAAITQVTGPAGTLAIAFDAAYKIPSIAKQTTWDGMLPKTGGTATTNHITTGDLWVDTEIRVDTISASSHHASVKTNGAQQLVLNAGESGAVDKASNLQTSEKIYLNAEMGIEISSSSTNNWDAGGSTWLNKRTTTINKDGIVTDGSVSASSGGFVGDLQGTASSATEADTIKVVASTGNYYWSGATLATASTIAARDGSGDIYATRFRGEVIGNASTATNSQQFASSTAGHTPGSADAYWLVNNWNGSYWRITSVRPAGTGENPNVSVQHASVTDYATQAGNANVLRQNGTSATKYAYIIPENHSYAPVRGKLYTPVGLYVDGTGYFGQNVTLADGKTLTGNVVGNASSATNATKIQINGGVSYWPAATTATNSTVASRTSTGKLYANEFVGPLNGNVTGNVTGSLTRSGYGSFALDNYYTADLFRTGNKAIRFRNTVTSGDARISHDITGGGRFVIYPALQLSQSGTNGLANAAVNNKYWLINANGDVYNTGGLETGAISCTTIASSSITVSGTISATGDITAFAASDKRLKDNISPIENALEKVASISGNTFDWNDKADKEGSEIGVIAQEIEALGLPGVTTTREDGYKAVRYEKLVPLLIEAIKELSLKVEELQK